MINRPKFYEFVNESKADDLANGIDKAINKVDDSLGYSDFAKAVAKILDDNYGSHNYVPFMKALHKELGIK